MFLEEIHKEYEEAIRQILHNPEYTEEQKIYEIADYIQYVVND